MAGEVKCSWKPSLKLRRDQTGFRCRFVPGFSRRILGDRQASTFPIAGGIKCSWKPSLRDQTGFRCRFGGGWRSRQAKRDAADVAHFGSQLSGKGASSLGAPWNCSKNSRSSAIIALNSSGLQRWRYFRRTLVRPGPRRSADPELEQGGQSRARHDCLGDRCRDSLPGFRSTNRRHACFVGDRRPGKYIVHTRRWHESASP